LSISSFINIESTTINGIPIIARVVNVARLGGIGNPNTAKALLEYTPPIDGNLKKAILSIFVTGKDLSIGFRWKVKYCGVTLSREFRPQIITSANDISHAVLVFDITPVVLANLKTHEVLVSYDGIHPIILDGITMLTLYEHKDSISILNYSIGVSIIKPNSSETFNIGIRPLKDSNTSLTLSYYTPSRYSAIEIAINDRTMGTYYGSVGVDELEIPIRDFDIINDITLRHIASTEYSSPIRVLETALVSVRLREPKFDIELMDVKPNDYVRLRVTNVGETKPDHMLLVAISRGLPLYKCKLNNLDPNQSVEVKLPFKAIRHQKSFIARVIWTKAGRTFFKDSRIEI